MINSTQLIFADGIANLSYSAGAFRFDLATIKQASQQSTHKSKDQNNIEVDAQAHIIMTPQAFIQTFHAMENFVKMVEEKGIIRFGEQSTAHVKAEAEAE